MKSSLALFLLIVTTPLALAQEVPPAATKETVSVKAPNGGRLISRMQPPVEFLVRADRRVEIRFLDAGKTVSPSGQIATVVTGSRKHPIRIAFEVEGEKLLSATALPEGSRLPIVLQIKADAEAKAVTERFTLDLAPCPTCDALEYACTCAHSHD